MEKPITMQIDELKKDLAGVINNSKLPIVLLDFILKDMYTEVHSVYQLQLEKDIENYNASLEEETDE